jgi:hypothetical protein
MLEVLKRWTQTSQFAESGDWMFGSRVQLGRLPFSYDGVWQALRNVNRRLSSSTLPFAVGRWPKDIDRLVVQRSIQPTFLSNPVVKKK